VSTLVAKRFKDICVSWEQIYKWWWLCFVFRQGGSLEVCGL